MKRFLYIPDKLLCWKTINTFFSRLIRCQEVFRVHWFERIYIYIYISDSGREPFLLFWSRKWRTGRTGVLQKVAVPGARAWLRPWRSAWMRAAAAGGVWGRDQMSFTALQRLAVTLLSECSFQELPSFSQTLTCDVGAHSNPKKKKKTPTKQNRKIDF